MTDVIEEESILETSLINRDLIISLIGGQNIGPFNVTWNYGLREFLEAYEQYLKGSSQAVFRFRMKPDPQDTESTLIIDFKNVTAVSSVTKPRS